MRYETSRTDRKYPQATLKVEYRGIGDIRTAQCGTLDDFLTSRYCLFSADTNGNLFRGDVAHDPWELQEAQAIVHENSMTDWLDIELPDTAPLLHFACYTSVIASSLRKLS